MHDRAIAQAARGQGNANLATSMRVLIATRELDPALRWRTVNSHSAQALFKHTRSQVDMRT
eukprot:12444563-Alexandrium_andersonii.AAC.1